MFVLLIYNKGGCKMFIIKGGDNNEYLIWYIVMLLKSINLRIFAIR